MLPDWIALCLAFVYILAAVGLGEALRRWLHWPQDSTRKFIHIAVGMISVPTVLLFQSLGWAIIPPLSFVIINYLDYRFGFIQAMTASNRSNLGTVYFPLSFAIILLAFWGDPNLPAAHARLIVAALMPMTWGDALAAIVGERFARRRYHILGSARSLEGSAAMFAASALAVYVALGMFSLDGAAIAAAVALAATLAEAASPWGIDNLSVPAVSALALALLLKL